MQLGIFGLNSLAAHLPDTTLALARQAEELGYDSVWAGEHVVLPDPRVSPSPMEPGDAILDPLVHLAFVAAATTKLRLGTGIIILPQRNPLVLAKQVASLDVLSKGRLILGIGAGYLEPELTAIGVPLSERGARTDEYIDAMRALWNDEAPSFKGRHANFAGIDAHPRPAQSGGPPVVIGGHTPAAHRRAVERGNGWYGFALDVAAAARNMEGLRQAAAQFERPAFLGPLEISVTPRGRTIDAATVAQFGDLGVHRLVLYPLPLSDPAAAARYLEDHAALVS
jgi:probable F420-dependent oxidoreductase